MPAFRTTCPIPQCLFSGNDKARWPPEMLSQVQFVQKCVAGVHRQSLWHCAATAGTTLATAGGRQEPEESHPRLPSRSFSPQGCLVRHSQGLADVCPGTGSGNDGGQEPSACRLTNTSLCLLGLESEQPGAPSCPAGHAACHLGDSLAEGSSPPKLLSLAALPSVPPRGWLSK